MEENEKIVCYWCELENTNKGFPKPDVPATCRATKPFEGKYACRGHGDLLLISGWHGGLLDAVTQENEYSTKHPHEPEIPATYDDEGRCLICGLLVQVAKLEEENKALKKEKERRIYYQSIVYEMCNILDLANNKQAGTGIVCGTLDEPSREAQEGLIALLTGVDDETE